MSLSAAAPQQVAYTPRCQRRVHRRGHVTCQGGGTPAADADHPLPSPPPPVAPPPPFARLPRSTAGRLPHFLHINDLSTDQLAAVLASATKLKAAYRDGDTSYQPLKGKSLAMIFAKPSLRTRVSFEVVRALRPAKRGVRPAWAGVWRPRACE